MSPCSSLYLSVDILLLILLFSVSLILTRSTHEHFQVPVVSGREGCFRMCHCDGTSKLSNCRILECIEPKECRFKGKVKSKLKFSFTDVLTQTYHLSLAAPTLVVVFSPCLMSQPKI